jgi:hypothetical protein
MAYQTRITRAEPACLVILVDQSASMIEPWGTGKGNKAQGVSQAVNMALRTLALMCKRGAEFYPYFDVAVIGYGNNAVNSAFGGALAGQSLVSIAEIAPKPVRVEERTQGETTIKMPIWVEPMANGNTPMVEALEHGKQLLESWIARHRTSFPPIVLNITDGEASTGDPVQAAREVAALRTDAGNVLMMNCHISSQAAQPLLYPGNIETLPDKFAQQLYAMSSPFPNEILEAARQKNIDGVPQNGARAFAFNVGLEGMMRFVSVVVGTMQAQR